MTESERHLLADLRRNLLHLHKTLLDWERAAYDRVHGRTAPGELLRVVMTDPQFAWLRPLSELIARIDDLSLSSTGSFRHADGQTLPW